MLIKNITKSFQETQKLGEDFAKEILALRRFASQGKNNKRAIVFGLQGDLGSGKTTFIQGFAKGLGVDEKILSPTFVILKRFAIDKKTFKNFYHIDCYRLKNEKDILELGIKEIILNSKNIVAIEWPEKIKKVLPKKTITIKFNLVEKNKRKIILDEII